MLKKCLLLVCVLLCAVGVLVAQTASTGALEGTVSDASGAVIPNASVTLTSADTGQVRTGTTGADGVYRFSLLTPGTYNLKFAASGFKNSEAKDVKINVTETPVYNEKLEVGGATEQVTVEANVETLQTASSALGNRGRRFHRDSHSVNHAQLHQPAGTCLGSQRQCE